VIQATIQGINTDVNTKTVTLTPLSAPGATATTAKNMGAGIFGWVCGSTGSTIDKKYLPGSCRGI